METNNNELDKLIQNEENETEDLSVELNKLLNKSADKHPYDSITLTKDIVILFIISKFYDIDFVGLLLAYEDLGPKIFMIFYLFSGTKINIPSDKKYLKLIYFGKEIHQALQKNAPIDLKLPPKFQNILDELQNFYNREKNEIYIDYGKFDFNPILNMCDI